MGDFFEFSRQNWVSEPSGIRQECETIDHETIDHETIDHETMDHRPMEPVSVVQCFGGRLL